MIFYIIQTTHITDKGSTITRYYSRSSCYTWSEDFEDVKLFKNREEAEFVFNQWYNDFAGVLCSLHYEFKEVHISIK